MTAYLLSLFAAVFTGNCDAPPDVCAATVAQRVAVEYSNSLALGVSLVTLPSAARKENAAHRKNTEAAFQGAEQDLTEVFFTLGEKYEGSFFKFIVVQLLEQKIDLPNFERAGSVKLPNQPTLVALKVILQV